MSENVLWVRVLTGSAKGMYDEINQCHLLSSTGQILTNCISWGSEQSFMFSRFQSWLSHSSAHTSFCTVALEHPSQVAKSKTLFRVHLLVCVCGCQKIRSPEANWLQTNPSIWKKQRKRKGVRVKEVRKVTGGNERERAVEKHRVTVFNPASLHWHTHRSLWDRA